ncbi:MAG: thioredoxin [Sphaerochaetaceae bacterium]|jgi:thioredoxin 1
MIKHVTAETFKQEVLESKVPVLVDFWATWCGPCRMQGQILESLDKKMDETNTSSTAVLAKVNVDEQQELAMQFGVMSIPTLIVFKDGKAVAKEVGVRNEDQLQRMLMN